LFHCFWQLAHLALSLAHSFFAASHRALVQVSTLTESEGFDDDEAAAAGLVDDGGVCAIAALDSTTVTMAAARQKLVRDLFMSSPLVMRSRPLRAIHSMV